MPEKLDLLFLGTGTAIPTKNRNHTGVLLTWKNEKILVDCGEGIQRQFKMLDLSPTRLTRVLITHWHADHALGLAGLLHTLHMSGYSKTLHLHGPKGTKEKISLLEKVFGRFRIQLKITEGSGKILEDKEFLIEAAEMSHGTPTNAYSFTMKDRRRIIKSKLRKFKLKNSPLIGELQKGKDITIKGKKIKSSSMTYLEKGRKVSIILDTSMNNNAITISKNSDLVICESSFSSQDKEKAKEYNHLTAEDAAQIAKKSKSKKLALVHISQRYDNKENLLLKQARKIFSNTIIPKDFDNISL